MVPRRPTKRQFGTVSQLPSAGAHATPDPTARNTLPPQHSRNPMTPTPGSPTSARSLTVATGSPPKQRARAEADDARTVGDWLTEWLELRTRGTNPLGPATHQNYTQTINRRILKVSGKAARLRDIPLTKLTRRDVAAWWDAINLQYDTPPTIRAAYKRLRTAIEAAVERDMIDANPVVLPSAANAIRHDRKQLFENQVITDIIKELDPKTSTSRNVRGDHKLIAILTLVHGVRLGEAPRRTTQRLHQTRRHMDLPHQRQRLPRHRRPQRTTRHGLQKTASKTPPATATSQSSPTTTTTWNTTSNTSPTPAPTHSSSPAPPAKSSWTPHTAPS